jgi:hypothetical protein
MALGGIAIGLGIGALLPAAGVSDAEALLTSDMSIAL